MLGAVVSASAALMANGQEEGELQRAMEESRRDVEKQEAALRKREKHDEDMILRALRESELTAGMCGSESTGVGGSAGGHWEAARDPQTGRTYYQNHVTKETQWHPPATTKGPEPPVPGVAPVMEPLQSPGQMMQVAVPNGKIGGEVMQVQTTRGLMQVSIPRGLQAGQSFRFNLPDEPGQSVSSDPGPVPGYDQLPVQVSMSNPTLRKTNSILGANAEVHPLVEKLQAGLKIYSQSFREDAWLTFKNSHILLSCFTVHPAHHFDAKERCGVLFTSLLVAFGLSAILESFGENDNSIASTVLLAAYSVVLQYAYDYFAEASVSCSCVQRSQTRVKDACECIGKFAFLYLVAIALTIFVYGVIALNSDGGRVIVALISFGVTRMANIIFFSSLSHLVFFWYYRKSQMKPSAEVLATEEGKKVWVEPTKVSVLLSYTGILTKRWPCEMWNKHIGEALSFDDLPLHAPDYDFRVKISLICCSCTIYEHKAKVPHVLPQVCNDYLIFD